MSCEEQLWVSIPPACALHPGLCELGGSAVPSSPMTRLSGGHIPDHLVRPGAAMIGVDSREFRSEEKDLGGGVDPNHDHDERAGCPVGQFRAEEANR